MPTPCARLNETAPRIPVLYGEPIPERIAAVSLVGGLDIPLRFTMRDRNGNPIDLSDCEEQNIASDTDSGVSNSITGGAINVVNLISVMSPFGGEQSLISSSSSSSSSIVVPAPLTAELRFFDPVASQNLDYFHCTGTVIDASKGLIELSINGAMLPGPGIYDAEIGILDANSRLKAINRFYLSIERSLFGNNWNGPLTLAEIRLHLRDSAFSENLLLDELAYSDAEIIACIRRPVDFWNEALPPIPLRYTPGTFPFRYWHLEGIKSCLYRIAAEWYRRNHLAYQAGGMSIDDLNKSQEYEQAAEIIWQRYEAWAQSYKIHLNVMSGFATEASAYLYIGSGYYPAP